MSAYSGESPLMASETRYITVNDEPTPIATGYLPPHWKVTDVAVALKRGIEVQIGSPEIAAPGADCWFAVALLNNRVPDYNDEIVVTNGEDFYLRRSMGKSFLVLNVLAAMKINDAITAYATSLHKGMTDGCPEMNDNAEGC